MSDATVLLSKWFSNGGIFLAKGQLDHSYTFWTMPILIFSLGANFGHHPLVNQIPSFLANEIKISESKCSAKCGVGKKTITYVTSETVGCGNSHCKPDIHELEVDCDTKVTCPPEQKNPEWSEWSSCSDDCIKNVNEKPTQTRKGSCNGCRLAILQVYKTA